MSIFRGLSKEFQVGALTAIAITTLILGYNFMRGKDNPFKSGTDIYVYYERAQGLSIGTSVMFNGLRIGQLSSLDITEDGDNIEAVFEIGSSLNIPADSKMEIQSEILGGQKVRLVMGRSENYVEDGDTLVGTYAQDQFSAINEQIVPLASKADSLLTTMNGFFQAPGLNRAVEELPIAVHKITELLQKTQELLAVNQDALTRTVSNIDEFAGYLDTYRIAISNTLSRLDKTTQGLETIHLAASVRRIDTLTEHMNLISKQLVDGEGTIGKLLYSDSLHNSLVGVSEELNRVLLDLKKYPEKYLPIPMTKRQRKKAKDASKLDSAIWPN